jgi:hypothetical protein
MRDRIEQRADRLLKAVINSQESSFSTINHDEQQMLIMLRILDA